MIEKTYSKFIADHGDAQMRRALFDADAPAAGNVVALGAVTYGPARTAVAGQPELGILIHEAYDLLEKQTGAAAIAELET